MAEASPRIRRDMRLLLAAILLLFTFSEAAAKPDIVAARIGGHPDKTRFVLELSQEPQFRVFTLPDPFRVVIDLPEFNWRVNSKNTPRAGGVIKAMRFGLFAPGTSRVVLDVAKPVLLDKVFVILPDGKKPYRFVLDARPVTRSAYFTHPDGKRASSKRPLVAAAATARVPVPSPSDTRPIIVIDPGHGGVDPGAVGALGTKEKDLALEYAKALQRALEASGAYRVVLTRRKDRFIKLRDRILIAQKAEGDLLVSLHANVHPSGKVKGASVYTLSETASDKEAGALAKAENSADVLAGVDLAVQSDDVREILIDLAQRETMNYSKRFANRLMREVGKSTALLRNSHRSAGFAVLKSPTVPSVLFEIGYMSNKQEEKLLRSEAHRKKIVKSMTTAIDAYFAWRQSVSRS